MDFLNGILLAQPGVAAPKPGSGAGEASFLDTAIDWLIDHISVQAITEKMTEYGPGLLKAVAIFVVGRWIARVVTNSIVRAAKKARMDATLLGFLNNLIYMLLLTAVCIASLSEIGVDTTNLTAVMAAAGFAIGMAMQGSLGNLAAGVMLVFFKPFRVGELVEIGGTQGRVVEIQIFNTILLTLDNVRIIVPNGKITDGTIQNYSAERERRIDMVIGCGYNDNLKDVKQTLQAILKADDRVLDSPEPVVAVAELGDSSVNFVVRPWVVSEDYWDVRFALTEKIKLAFDEHGYTIPFPSQDLFIHNPDADVDTLPLLQSRAA